jgi:hypothetical protein
MIFKISRSITNLITLALAGAVFGLFMAGGFSAGFWFALWMNT